MATAMGNVRHMVETACGRKYLIRTYKVIDRFEELFNNADQQKRVQVFTKALRSIENVCASKPTITSFVKTEF